MGVSIIAVRRKDQLKVWVKIGIRGKAVKQKMVLQKGFIYGLFPDFVLKLLRSALCSTLL